MNASIVLVFAFVACAAAFVPAPHVPQIQNDEVTVHKSTTVGNYPYGLHHIYGTGYYPFHAGLYNYYRYPYHNQYSYGYPHYFYGKSFPYYYGPYQSQYYGAGYHHYPYYHYPYYQYNYPTVY